MAPAVKNYRKYLVDDLHHARIIENEESLAELYAKYDILAPYIQLFKAFPKVSPMSCRYENLCRFGLAPQHVSAYLLMALYNHDS